MNFTFDHYKVTLFLSRNWHLVLFFALKSCVYTGTSTSFYYTQLLLHFTEPHFHQHGGKTLHEKKMTTSWRLRWHLAVFSKRVFFKLRYVHFLDGMLLIDDSTVWTTFVGAENRKPVWFTLWWYLFYRCWSGPEPTISPKYACIYGLGVSL